MQPSLGVDTTRRYSAPLSPPATPQRRKLSLPHVDASHGIPYISADHLPPSPPITPEREKVDTVLPIHRRRESLVDQLRSSSSDIVDIVYNPAWTPRRALTLVLMACCLMYIGGSISRKLPTRIGALDTTAASPSPRWKQVPSSVVQESLWFAIEDPDNERDFAASLNRPQRRGQRSFGSENAAKSVRAAGSAGTKLSTLAVLDSSVQHGDEVKVVKRDLPVLMNNDAKRWQPRPAAGHAARSVSDAANDQNQKRLAADLLARRDETLSRKLPSRRHDVDGQKIKRTGPRRQ